MEDIHRGSAPRVVMLSNREPYRVEQSDGTVRIERTTGGLVSALEPLMRRNGGTWISWHAGGGDRTLAVPGSEPRFTLRQLAVSEEEKQRYYDGCANSVLWPLFHHFINQCAFHRCDLSHYQRINQRFADAAVESSRAQDLVWVHDYHLCLAPAMIRQRRPRSKVAFFLHTPFPAWSVLQILNWRSQLLEGLLGSDLLGFQTQSDVNNFLDCCRHGLGLEVDVEDGSVRWQDRLIRVGAFPVGVDACGLQRVSEQTEVREQAIGLRQAIGGEKLIVSVDRLDYTKGILQRIEAIGRYFSQHPERVGRDTFVQVAIPSRLSTPAYAHYKRQVDEAVGSINGRYATPRGDAVRYLTRQLTVNELAALYRAADTAVVTPLRDGMNLVAKEFCACSQNGVLVLSRTAGNAAQMRDGPLLVNPYDVDEQAAAIHHAVHMPREERARRLSIIREGLVVENDQHWLNSFLAAGLQPDRRPALPQRTTRRLPPVRAARGPSPRSTASTSAAS